MLPGTADGLESGPCDSRALCESHVNCLGSVVRNTHEMRNEVLQQCAEGLNDVIE